MDFYSAFAILKLRIFVVLKDNSEGDSRNLRRTVGAVVIDPLRTKKRI